MPKTLILVKVFNLSFESDMSGMILIAEGAKLEVPKIFYVTQASPASDAGLRVGDIITAIDGKPSSTLTLDSIREMLKQKWTRAPDKHQAR